MYAQKQGGRLTAGERSSGVLLHGALRAPPEARASTSTGVAELAEALALKLGLAEQEVARARLAGELHDVGKMAIPDAILDKPGPLTDDEWEFVHRHTADRRADPARGAGARARRGRRPLEPRALRRHGLSRRARRHGDPARLADRLRLRRLRRDDGRAALPARR